MEIRESGMPSEDVWETFFAPEAALRLLGLTEDCHDVVEFGCGYGTFTIAAASIVSGSVYALDINPEMARRTAEKATAKRLKNVIVGVCDFVDDDLPVPIATADYAMLFNILHADQPEVLLRRAKSVLRENGLLGIMHWNHDINTPRGPTMSIRPRPEDCARWAEDAGFVLRTPHVELPPWHYGLVAAKP
jgi:SAM-dependent methyltransferase